MTDEERAKEFLNGRSHLGWVHVAALIAAVRADEREACAKVAETTYAQDPFHFELGTAVAAASRARGPMTSKKWVDDTDAHAAIAEVLDGSPMFPDPAEAMRAKCEAIARTYEQIPWSINAMESDAASAVCKSLGNAIAALKDKP